MQNPALRQAVIPRGHLSYAEHKSRSQQEELTHYRHYSNLQLEEWGEVSEKVRKKRCTHKQYMKETRPGLKSLNVKAAILLSCDTQEKTRLWPPISYSHTE